MASVAALLLLVVPQSWGAATPQPRAPQAAVETGLAGGFSFSWAPASDSVEDGLIFRPAAATPPLSDGSAWRTDNVGVAPLRSTLDADTNLPIMRSGAISTAASGRCGSSVFVGIGHAECVSAKSADPLPAATADASTQVPSAEHDPAASGSLSALAFQGSPLLTVAQDDRVDATAGLLASDPGIAAFTISAPIDAGPGSSKFSAASYTLRLPMQVASVQSDPLGVARVVPSDAPAQRSGLASAFSLDLDRLTTRDAARYLVFVISGIVIASVAGFWALQRRA